MKTSLFTVVLVTQLVAPALAEPPPPTTDEPTAFDVAGTPLPGDESGRLDVEPSGDTTARKIARGALFVPRVAVEAAFMPVQGGLWAYERYQLGERARRLFWNDARTIGLFPTIRLESGFGINAGAHFVHRDLAGDRERLDLVAGAGGRFRQLYEARLRSGERLGERVVVELAAGYERRPKDAFYGIGNADGVAVVEAPLDRELSTEARYRQRIVRARGSVDVRVASDFRARAAGAITDRAYADGQSGPAIAERYMTERLVGFDGTRNAYGELELRWDSRRAAHAWEPPVLPTTGTLAAVYAGRVVALDAHADFWRYGIDLQRFIRLAAGPRVLALRAHAEAVSGSLDEVPFDELPRLGGKDMLRGYPLDRFRDRVAAVASAEYQWDLTRNLSASVFVDAGRVYRSVRDVELADLRAGYGIALEGHTDRSFIARVSLASSIDGGVFVDFALDPVFDLQERIRR